MTLNLTLLSTSYVMQVSDRRLTDKMSGGEFDALANKNVVYLARDGLFTLCYSGPAYLEGVPTDTWIACKLAGEDIAPHRDGRGLRDRRRSILMRGRDKEPWLDIGQAVELLRKECEALNLGIELTIGVAGWQNHKRGRRPVFWVVEAEGRSATADNPIPRCWQDERSRQGGRPFQIYAIPDWPLSQLEMDKLMGLLMNEVRSADAAVQRLVWAVRYVAGKTRGVGPDCMCILLPNPDAQPELFVRYEPVTEERAVITGGERNVKVPAAFTPWFVGPQIHAPPSIIIGGHMPFNLGAIRLIAQAPPVPRGTGVRGGFSTQRRPPDPSSRRPPKGR